MKETTVVNKYKNTYDLYIGRLGDNYHFGNPFSHQHSTLAKTKVETRDQAIEAFRDWLYGLNYLDIEPERRQWIIDNINKLEGKTLGCFCKPKACHGDILIEYLNNRKK